MHTIQVLAFGSENFNTSLEELKDYLNFKLTTSSDDLKNVKVEFLFLLVKHNFYF